MNGTARRRLKSLGVALFAGCMATYGGLSMSDQIGGLSTSRAIQAGPVVTGTTLGRIYAGAHGGARLRVEITTLDGQRLVEHVWDGYSDGVHVQPSMPIAYLPSTPFEAEVAGQPMHTRGQAVLDAVTAMPIAVIALVCLLAACGVPPFDNATERMKARNERLQAARQVRTRRGSRRGAWR